MAADQEFYPFLSTFLHLLNTGKSAQLVFECQDGAARVHLHHALDNHPPPQPDCREREYRHRHQGPSRLRRRARRAKARAATAAGDKAVVNKKETFEYVAQELAGKAAQQDQAVQALPPPQQVREVAVQTARVVHHEPGQQVKLSIDKAESTDIPPRRIYHPAVIRACLSMFRKKPGELNDEEIQKFNLYRAWKRENGEEIESDMVYNPASGNQPCLHCGHLT